MSAVCYHSKPIYHVNGREKGVNYLLITIFIRGDPEKFSYSEVGFELRALAISYALNRFPYLNK